MIMDRPRVHILYEHTYDMRPFGSASIRLLHPLTHPALQKHFMVSFSPLHEGQQADVFIVDRLWRREVTLESVENLVKDIRAMHAKLIYALDDNYFNLPSDHSLEFSEEQLKVVEYLLRQADCVWVTTPALKEQYQSINENVIVLQHALDERLLIPKNPGDFHSLFPRERKVIGYMGTYTHDDDLLMILPALQAVWQNHKDEVEIQFVGGIENQDTKTQFQDLPVRQVSTKPGEEEYPLFMMWYTSQIDWDIAIAPLRDTPFNRSKSDIKLLDYSAIGAAGVYSHVPAYQSSVRHLETGWLAENRTDAWVNALESLLVDEKLRNNLARKSYQYLASQRTLAHCAHWWLEALRSTLEA